MECLERLSEGRTTFLITHRPSTTRRADRVIRIENGNAFEMTNGVATVAHEDVDPFKFRPLELGTMMSN
jgi:ABC-type bacteriocin/lantibiotic exporter with double-glycine peptidase domain